MINLSNKPLDENTINILNKGLKFTVTKSEVLTLELITAIENAAKKSNHKRQLKSTDG